MASIGLLGVGWGGCPGPDVGAPHRLSSTTHNVFTTKAKDIQKKR